MKIEIERHSPLDGDYYFIMIDGHLFAKTWTNADAEKIAKAMSLLDSAEKRSDYGR